MHTSSNKPRTQSTPTIPEFNWIFCICLDWILACKMYREGRFQQRYHIYNYHLHVQQNTERSVLTDRHQKFNTKSKQKQILFCENRTPCTASAAAILQILWQFFFYLSLMNKVLKRIASMFDVSNILIATKAPLGKFSDGGGVLSDQHHFNK